MSQTTAWSAVIIGGLDGSTELRLYLHLRVEVVGDELYLAYLWRSGGSNVNVRWSHESKNVFYNAIVVTKLLVGRVRKKTKVKMAIVAYIDVISLNFPNRYMVVAG
jgi:hypothetical protein